MCNVEKRPYLKKKKKKKTSFVFKQQSLVFEWWSENLTEKPVYAPKCLVFELSAKSHDFTILIPDTPTVRYSDESSIQVFGIQVFGFQLFGIQLFGIQLFGIQLFGIQLYGIQMVTVI